MVTEHAIERATPDLSERLTEIAHASKRHWGYPERYITAWKDELTITPRLIEENETFIARLGGEISACCVLRQEGSTAHLEHMWVLPDVIGSGIGRRLFEHAAERARQLGAAELEIISDPNAAGFYAHLGARQTGEFHGELEGRERILPIYTLKL